jgi:hypothetical protein
VLESGSGSRKAKKNATQENNEENAFFEVLNVLSGPIFLSLEEIY